MASDWPEYSLHDVSELIIDCPHSTPEWTDEGVVVLRNQYIRNGRLDLSAPSYTTEEGYQNRIKRAVPSTGDLVLTREAPMGEVCQIPEGLRCCLGQRMVLVRANQKIIDPKYLLFVIQSPYLQHQISWNEGTGTTVSNIRIPNLKAFRIPTPSLSEQKSIAHILGTLDDKIELNRQMNATLEAMAQALFKSWFVDFDPVIDNALAAGNPIPEPLQPRAEARTALGDQRKPLPEAIQKQFPNRFVFNEDMGWVPDGWVPIMVGELFDVTMGQSPPGDTYNENGVGMPFFQGRADFGFRFPANRVYCTAPKRLASKDDTLVSVRAPVGDVNMAVEDCCIGRGVSAIRHKSGSRSFTYYAMLQLREHFKVYEAEGTVFGSINQKDFKALPQLDIEHKLVMSFHDRVDALDEKIGLGSRQIEQLSRLRDTLLPKLLSGQLRIPEAEQQLAEAL